MKRSFNSWLLPLLILLAACNSGKLKLDSRNFEEEFDLQQNLVFNFNQDLVGDSVLNNWIDTGYVKFTPEVKGRFRWTSKDELVFSPSLGFLPSTEYKIDITDKVMMHSAKKYSLSDVSFTAHTPWLNIVSGNSFWSLNESNRSQIELRTELYFNSKINVQDIKSLITVEIDGKAVACQVIGTGVSDKALVTVPESDSKFDDKKMRVTIKPGLKCAESEYKTKENLLFETVIANKTNFQVITMDGTYEDDKAVINVMTNQEPAEQNIEGLITINPSLNFDVEKNGSGFLIRGAFQEGTAYKVIVRKELKGIFGGTLKENFERDVTFGAQEPHISFTSKKGVYLSSKGDKNVGLKIINVPNVRVQIYKIYENNIIQFLKNNFYSYSDYEEDYYDYGGSSSYRDMDNLGDQVYDKVISSRDLSKSGSAHLLNLNFADINAIKGIYVVKVSSEDKSWINASKIVALSDIGMIVRQTEEEIIVFANSIISAEPLEGVEVNLVSHNNQNVYKLTTDGKGVARFADLKVNAANFHIKMITTNKDGDFNYLHFDESRIESSQYDVGGARDNPSGYEAFYYSEREIYRPGDTLHYNVIFRDREWKPVKDIPVKVKIILPNGKEFVSHKGKLNDEGAFTSAVMFPVSTVTGTYQAEVYTANDVLMCATSISVEEFIPDRIKVQAVLSKEQLKLEQGLKVTATATNLFGPQASNRNYEMEVRLNKSYFYSEEFGSYTFGVSTGTDNFESILREGTTDAEGKAIQDFDFPAEYKNYGIIDGTVYITVFDESGRPVNQVKRFEILTQNHFYGIGNFDYYVGLQSPLTIPLVAVNREGKALNGINAKVQVIKNEWQTVLEKTYNGYRYVSQRRERLMEERLTSLSGNSAKYVFVPRESGSYEIRVSLPGAATYVSRDFYAYGYGSTNNSSFEVDTEGKVIIQADKKTYKPGEDAKLLFQTPFNGKLMVTVERNKVYDYYFLETDKKAAELVIPMKEEYLPNVYVSATLIKPNSDNAIPLTVGHGYTSLTVEQASRKIEVSITAPEKSRSRTTQKICVKAGEDSDVEVTIAIVDEGILQIKNTKTPDPYAYFFRKRALGVEAYDIYPRLLPEMSVRKNSSVGGDGYDLEKRVNPMGNKRVKLVSFWSGHKRTNSNGEVCIEVPIPQFSGDLRIMAVAYQGGNFGSGSKNMKVADPLVVSTSLPRFLSPGDSILVPVTLTNTTSKDGSADATLKVTGPLRVIGNASQSVSVKANSENRVMFTVVAEKAIGEASVSTSVKALGETFVEKTDIGVRAPSGLIKQSDYGSIAGNTSKALTIGQGLIPASTEAKLIISRSPLVQFTDQLDYLLQYPHGCVEQTTSAAFPQLYFSDLIKNLKSKRRDYQDPARNVQIAINRLYTMQLYNGGLSYWAGGYEESWWGTVYAAHFLTEAKKAGYEVNTEILNKIYSYLAVRIKEKRVYDYYYYEGSGYKVREIAAKETFYALYVLAMAGRQDLSVMNFYKVNRNSLALDSRYMLACTYLLLGDQGSYRSLLPSSFDEKSASAFSGSFYSYTRDMAITLNTLLDTDPTNAQVAILAKHLSEQLRRNQYMNTQEAAFTYVALGKLAKRSNSSKVTATIKSGGKNIGNYTDGTLQLTNGMYGAAVEVSTSGTGELYYYWQAEGLSVDGKVKEEDSYLSVRRTFYNRDGSKVNLQDIEQNDLIIVGLELKTTDGSDVENVVVTDILPAGFEIENPRLTELADMEWIREQSSPQHFDVRDDRIHFFTTSSEYKKVFYYQVRAVTKGTFILGPASADAMYNGEYHSYNGAGKVTVK